MAALVVAASAFGGDVTSGLVAHYPISAAAGDTVYDKGPHKLNGKITGAEWVTEGKATALRFNGPASRVICGAGPELELKNTVSLSVWMHAGKLPDGEVVLIGEGTDRYSITYYKTGNAYFYINSGGINVNTPAPLNKRVHLAATFDSTTMKIYVDGVLKATKAIDPVSRIVSNRPLAIGEGTATGAGFYGLVDDARIYNRVLTDAEVKTLFTNGPM